MQFLGQHLMVQEIQAGLHELQFKSAGSVNKFDAPTLAEFDHVTTLLSCDAAVTGLLVTSALETFIVGADIFEFLAIFKQPVSAIEQFITQQSQRFYRFAQLPFPTVACVNGMALGGGFEMALSCDERVLASTAMVGLPETTLGIIPGFGGCIRLSRLLNPLTAMQWITDAKPRSAAQAAADGAADAVVDREALRAEGLRRLEALVATRSWVQRRLARQQCAPIAAEPLNALKAALAPRAHVEPAPLKAVEVIESAQGLSEERALAVEARAFAHIATTQAAHALVRVFVNDQAVRKKAKQLAKGALAVQRVGVIGAGIMGSGIAETCAAVGLEVVLTDQSPEALTRAQHAMRKNLQRQVDSKRLSAANLEATLKRVEGTSDLAAFQGCDWVIEAVSERKSIKHDVFTSLNGVVSASSLLATNTSSLSVSELATVCPVPERLLGLHFFNPVPKMPLVEIIPGQATQPQVVAQAVALALTLKKVPIVVGECAGFLVNRVLMAYVAGFEAALKAGVPLARIDAVMTRFGWPMGPGLLMDVIGLDTMVAIGDIIGRGIRPALGLKSDSVMMRCVQRGDLGQKTGKGFYVHERDAQGRYISRPNDALQDLLPAGRVDESDQQIEDRLMCPMVFEAKRCLEEGIGHSPAEIDMAMILGLGFPKAKGGPLCLLEWRTEAAFRAAAKALESSDELYRVD